MASPQPDLVRRTAIASLATQVLLGIVTSSAFFLPVPAKAADDLRVILVLEVASQGIEFAYYLIVVCRYRTILTWTRYLDWVVSTPLMLVAAHLFFAHRNDEPLTVDDPSLLAALGLNWLMLACGFAVEVVPTLPRSLGLAAGGVAFVGSYTMLARKVRVDDAVSVALFAFMYAVWSLYGVAAALPDRPKNVMYNGLDVVSKNVYGLFLFAYVLAL